MLRLPVYRDGFSQGYKGMMEQVDVYCFIRQLHVPVVVVISIIRQQVMNTKEVGDAELVIALLVFFVMYYQHRYLQQLIETGVVQKEDK